MMYQFSGVNTITFYAVEVFKISGATWDSNTCTIVMGAIRLIFTIVGCIAMRRCGRRPLTFVSSKFRMFSMPHVSPLSDLHINLWFVLQVLAVDYQWFRWAFTYNTNIIWINMIHHFPHNSHGSRYCVFLHSPFAVHLDI